MSAPELWTERLLLHHWRESDLSAFAAMNADPQVMEWMPALLNSAQSNALAEKIQARLNAYPFGLWAVELRETGAFIGYVGLAVPEWEAHFTPCVEIGWRLARHIWGQGYATEAAREVLRYAFETLYLPEIVSFTVPDNRCSCRVMEKLGMTHNPGENFAHPKLPPDHALSGHVLYRLSRDAFGLNAC